jgi:ABC-2 type transport system permease protein
MKVQCAYSFQHGNTIFVSLIQPVMFTLGIGMMFRTGGNPELIGAAALGSGLMGVWNSNVVASGRTLETERTQQTLDLLLVSPTPAFVVIAGKALFNALLSLVSIALSYVSCILVFHITPSVENPALFALVVIGLALSVWAMGLVMASGFLLSPNNRRMIELLNYPFYLLGGFVVPLSSLPYPVRIVGRLIPLSWASEALGASADYSSGAVTQPAISLAVLFILAGFYGVIARRLFGVVERRYRNNGGLDQV